MDTTQQVIAMSKKQTSIADLYKNQEQNHVPGSSQAQRVAWEADQKQATIQKGDCCSWRDDNDSPKANPRQISKSGY